MIAMEFSPSVVTVLTLLGGILTTLIVSATTIIVTKLNRNTTLTEQNTAITQKTASDVEKVKADVDGMKSKDAARIAELEREAVSLKAQLAERKQVAALLAQYAARGGPSIGPVIEAAAGSESPAVIESLKAILDAIGAGTLKTQEATDAAHAAYQEANHVNVKISDLNERLLAQQKTSDTGAAEARTIGEATLAGVQDLAEHGTAVAREVLDVVTHAKDSAP